jgi:hypothetical protein
MMDQKRRPAFRRWLDQRKLRRIELLERKNIARTTLRDLRQQTGDENPPERVQLTHRNYGLGRLTKRLAEPAKIVWSWDERQSHARGILWLHA